MTMNPQVIITHLYSSVVQHSRHSFNRLLQQMEYSCAGHWRLLWIVWAARQAKTWSTMQKTPKAKEPNTKQG